PETDAALQRAAIGDAALFVDANGACRRKQALAEARSLPFSAHTAPSLHVHSCFALPPVAGTLRPDLSRPGLGLELKRADAARYAA
ncbi:MAG TPA: hypothetical protein VFU81_10445, partial [Thermomicrobiales bacterium]|nr:hypothetical protein [Thermomicrobiales bacterium]